MNFETDTSRDQVAADAVTCTPNSSNETTKPVNPAVSAKPVLADVETRTAKPVLADVETRTAKPVLADVETRTAAPQTVTPQAAKPEVVEVEAPAAEVEATEVEAPAAEPEVLPVATPAAKPIRTTKPARASKPERAEPEQYDEPMAEDEPESADESALDSAPAALRPALTRRGFDKLTAVQQAVADADDGNRDLRISSQTGSGKTVAIGFSMVERVAVPMSERAGPTTLIIAPTRELAMQVKEELGWLFADLRGVDCEVVTGGTSLDRERLRLRRKPSVLVGTPGRLLDHLRRGTVDISSVTQLVLDEADQMLDLGFKDELNGILECLPEERRTHLVSATFPPAVLELANRFQNHPILIQGTAPGEAHDDIEHIACRIGEREHYQAVVNMLLMAGNERTLVFVRTREETTRMADKLIADGFAAAPINGDLAQAQRTRTLAAFRKGTTRTLIATDVAARGLDIPSVTLVIHVELPIDSSTYVHRSGRTGRAGQKGQSVLLVPKARAQRTTRLFRMLRLEPRWTWAPDADTINKKQLERAEQDAMTMLTAAPAASAAKRAAAANLLRERDPIEVVATLLAKTMTKTREPFELAQPKGQYGNDPAPRDRAPRDSAPRDSAPRDFAPRDFAPRDFAPRDFAQRDFARREDAAPRGKFTPRDHDARPAGGFNKLPASQRGTPGAAPSWQRPNQDDGRPPEPGYTRFSINWGPRDGANPRRIMAHICRRGEVASEMIGAITMDGNNATFEVQNAVADEFATRVQRRDRRDPHLIIHRETFQRSSSPRSGGFRNDAPYRGPMRTRQSR